jgi:hypothetical protein
VALPKVLFGTVDVIGHDVGDSAHGILDLSQLINRCQTSGMCGGLALATKPP